MKYNSDLADDAAGRLPIRSCVGILLAEHLGEVPSDMEGLLRLPGVVLPLIDWRTYSRLLQALDGRRSLRLTYDRGTLEIMVISHAAVLG